MKMSIGSLPEEISKGIILQLRNDGDGHAHQEQEGKKARDNNVTSSSFTRKKKPATMAFFGPTNRLHDLLTEHHVERTHHNKTFEEVRLLSSLQELVKNNANKQGEEVQQHSSWTDLFARPDKKVIWVSDDCYLGRATLNTAFEVPDQFLPILSFNVVNAMAVPDWHLYAKSSETASATADSLMRLLAGSDIRELRVTDSSEAPMVISPSALEDFLKGSPALQNLCFFWVTLTAEHCKALQAAASLDLHLRICRCVIQDLGSALTTTFQCHCITGLTMENTKLNRESLQSLANSLRKSMHLETLELVNMRLAASALTNLADALQDNRGLVTLNLSRNEINDASWTPLIAALARHPSMKVLQLERTRLTRDRRRLTAEQRIPRTACVSQMLAENKVLIEIVLTTHEHDPGEWETCLRHLETNFYRPRVRAVPKQASRSGLLVQENTGVIYPESVYSKSNSKTVEKKTLETGSNMNTSPTGKSKKRVVLNKAA